MPDKAAVFRGRRKLGAEPFRELLVHAGAAVADDRALGAFWRGLRVMALDGTTLAVSDTTANEAVLGRVRARPSFNGPQARTLWPSPQFFDGSATAWSRVGTSVPSTIKTVPLRNRLRGRNAALGRDGR